MSALGPTPHSPKTQTPLIDPTIDLGWDAPIPEVELYRALIDAAPDALVVVDTRGLVRVANRQAETLFGYRLDELVGLSVDVLVPDAVRDVTVPQNRPMGAGVTLSGKNRDGSTFPVDISLSSIKTRDGLLVSVAVRDITERVALETSLAELHTDLERRVERRTSELVTVNRELENFAYAVSHDLRAPLRAVEGFTREILREAEAEFRPKVLADFRRVQAAAKRMGELIDDMLALSRLTRQELRVQRVDLSGLVDEVVAELRRGEPDRVVDVRIEDGIVGYGDPHLLRVAFVNLVSNAWKFTRNTPLPQIGIRTETIEGASVYVVSDNGAGFDMRHVDKLFNPFQRLHTSREFEGNGIGLATVHRVVQRHNGNAWAESVLGQGATFRFTLGTGRDSVIKEGAPK
jgi:PAS domain S-box-containing protein